MTKKALMLTLVLATIVGLILAGCDKAPSSTTQNLGSKPFVSPIVSLTFFIPLIQSVITLVLSLLGIYTMILAIKLLKLHIRKGS